MDKLLSLAISYKYFMLQQSIINANLYKKIQSLIRKQHSQKKIQTFQEISNEE